ncbi:MAG: hypothetical protein FJX73_09220 [Armatimonadetes bacterium]|nr:hypothetical protein [Armatimonadota bacterium]
MNKKWDEQYAESRIPSVQALQDPLSIILDGHDVAESLTALVLVVSEASDPDAEVEFVEISDGGGPH